MRQDLAPQMALRAEHASVTRRVLLVSGILYPVLYVAADILGSVRWEGYSYTSQAISELVAIGSPVKAMVSSLFIVVGVLLVASAVGVWRYAAEKPVLRLTGGLLAGIAFVGFAWSFFPIHLRGAERTLTDTVHNAIAGVIVLLILLAIGFSSNAFGRRFRIYSIVTIVTLIAFGLLSVLYVPRVEAQLPTPGFGIAERINVYGYALWVAVLAIRMLRVRETAPAMTRYAPPVRSAPPPRGSPFGIDGYVSAGFEAVRDAFAENFVRRHELGGACCVYHRGEKVVDLWGGVRNKTTGEPWEEDTMVIVYSTTKGLAAMTLAVAHSRGWLDYDERVSTYWPEFAQQGKGSITVRQLLAHQAGLFAFDEPVDKSVVADLDHLAVVMARQKPAWPPGTRQGYHAITLGFYEGELLRRVDPRDRSLGQIFQDEIATPLGLDFYIRLPGWISNSQLATLAKANPLALLFSFPPRLALATLNHRSNIYRALVVNPGSEIVLDEGRIYARDFEVPSGGGVGTARAIAHAYGVFATGGRELQLRPETLEALKAPAIPATNGFYDECLFGDIKYSLGFLKPCPVWPFGSEESFGAPGAGGSFGFADPKTGIGYGYVTSQMGKTITGDPRDVALRNALDSIISH
jgi:CubicO group peptidase (beta-lactamase class C family)